MPTKASSKALAAGGAASDGGGGGGAVTALMYFLPLNVSCIEGAWVARELDWLWNWGQVCGRK